MRSQSRTGFTLIELMVAMALTMFLMVILTQCFVLSLETFAGMKGIGDMQQNLRTATVVLLSDLSADKLEGDRRLSDPNIADPMYPIQAGFMVVQQGSLVKSFVTNPPPNPTPVPPLPAAGYYYQEGVDPNNVPSYLVNNHLLYLTVKRKGNRPESFFTAALNSTNAPNYPEFFKFFSSQTSYNMLAVTPPPNTVPNPDLPTATLSTSYPGVIYNPNLSPPYTAAGATPTSPAFYASHWAEVFYYLVRVGTTEEPNNPNSVIGTPTYSLYRAQFVMVPDSTNVNNKVPALAPAPIVTSFAALACNNTGAANLVFYSPMDAATAGGNLRTLGASPIALPVASLPTAAINERLLTGKAEGATLVLPNVLSFQVQIMPSIPAWNGTRTYAVGNLVVAPNGTNYHCIAGNTGFMPQNNANFWAVSPITGLDFIDVPTNGAALGSVYDTCLFNPTPWSNATAYVPGNVVSLNGKTYVCRVPTIAGLSPPNAAHWAPYTNNFGLKAIKVTMRVWDNATRQTRQASVMQDF